VRRLAPPPNFDSWALSGGQRYKERRTNINGTKRVVGGYHTDFLRRISARFLRSFEEEDDRPWFLYVAPSAPHKPYVPAPRHRRADVPSFEGSAGTGEKDLSDKPPYVRRGEFDLGDPRMIWRQQLRTLESVDDLVGKLFSTMDQLEESRDTLAIFMSDNGLLLGEHGFFAKRVPYEESVAIPLVARWPGVIQAGDTDDRLVANIDIAPTVMEAAGIEPTARFPMDGISLLSQDERDHLLLEEYENEVHDLPSGWASIRAAAYQYVEYYAPDKKSVLFREYYDLKSDPSQLENLLGDGDPSNDPDVEALSSRLARDRTCSGRDCP
jgi:arylsulfatase A-like enzyme